MKNINNIDSYESVYDPATMAMMADPKGYADSLIEQAAEASMRPERMHPFESAEYADACNTLQSLVTHLDEKVGGFNARGFVNQIRAHRPEVTERAALEKWFVSRAEEVHKHTVSEEVNQFGELVRAKNYHHRWSNNAADSHGKFSTDDATWFIVDRRDFQKPSKPALLLKFAHNPQMFYEINGNRTPYLGQFVSERYADGPNNQFAYLTSEVRMWELSQSEAEAYALRFAEGNRAVQRIKRITKEVAVFEADEVRASNPEPRPDPMAEAMRAVFGD